MPAPGVTTAVVHIDIWGLGGIEPSQNHSTDDPLDSTPSPKDGVNFQSGHKRWACMIYEFSLDCK